MRVQSQRQPIKGLTADEVAEQRAKGLGSVPPPATSRSYLQIIRENVFTTVNMILFAVGFALVLVGQYLDALVSVGVISFNLVIGLIQELRAKSTLDHIALLTRPNVRETDSFPGRTASQVRRSTGRNR
jgi:cation-transporting P-type ATPase E